MNTTTARLARRSVQGSLIMLWTVATVALSTTYHVNGGTGSNANSGTSAATPFKTITHALSVATSGDTIRVAAGSYHLALGEVFPLEMKSGVVLMSVSGATSTIINASGAMERVFNCIGNSSATIIQGFTITGGRVTASSNGSNSVGGGISCTGGDQTIIQNNIITRDTARGYHFNEVTNGRNGGNAYGGGIYVAGAAPTIRNNVISHNVVMGGGGENWQGGFSGTPAAGGFAVGGGIAAAFAGAMTVVNNTFYGNTAMGGPGGTTNNGIDPPGAGGDAYAGALDAGFNVTAFNNIFVNNSATGGPPGGSGTPGPSSDGAVTAGQASQLSYNLYFNNSATTNPNGGQLGSTGSVFQDPLFVSAVDLHLSSTSSPAYHAGTATGAPARDLDGTLRGNPPSIGAYEGTAPVTSIEPSERAVPRPLRLDQNYPNPFNPTTTIEFTVPEDGRTTLKVFDLLGREVLTLLHEDLKAGLRHRALFDASALPTGVYVARLQAGGQQTIRRMSLVK